MGGRREEADGPLAGLRRSLLEDALWLIPIAVYAGLYEFLRLRRGLIPSPATTGHLFRPELVTAVGAAIALVLLQIARPRILRLVLRSHRDRLLEAYPGQGYARPGDGTGMWIRQAFGGVWAWVGWGLLMATFISYKGSIPALHPFSWDVRFMEWDRLLHGGTDPWRILQPLLGHPGVTRVMDAAYYAWFPVGMGVVLWQSVTRHRELRLRFFLSYVLCWILLGTVMATAFSSAGPVYFERVTGVEGPFEGLMAYLHRVDAIYGLETLEVQAHLWSGYAGENDAIIRGIAAMPSLHVAMPVLYGLAARERSRGLAVAFWLYALVILLGSVHLAWHYAIDGYASLLLVPLLWWAAGRLVERYPAVGDPPARGRSPR